MMNQNNKELFPQWTKEKQDRYLIMSNDLDSILSCTLLNMVQGYEINGYYSFNEGLGFINPNIGKKHIGVDIAFNGQAYCWDNHVTIIDSNYRINKNSANLNTIYKVKADKPYNYFKKFAGSTTLQICAYYDIELPSTDEGKMMLLSIDSAYLGFYDNRFKDTWIGYMEILGLHDLIQFCENHTKEEFKQFKLQYTEGIEFVNGYVSYESRSFVETCLGFKLYIPEKQFLLHTEMVAQMGNPHNVGNLSRNENVFSYAVTGINKVKYTTFN